MEAGEWGCGEEQAHPGQTVKAEPREFSTGLVVGRKLQRGFKHGSRVFGLRTLKVKSSQLWEALPGCFAHSVPLRADPRRP